MTDFDADGVERSMELDGRGMSTLLRWTVHTLEIFMWPEDYDLDPASLVGCFLDDWDEDADDDLLDEDTALVISEREASWRVWIEYADNTTQEILSYQDCLMDRPKELYLALLEYFEPEIDEFSEEYTEDDPFA